MNVLTNWYPGDAACFWILDTLIFVTFCTSFVLLLCPLLARRAALRCTLCSAALLLVISAPLLAFASARLPWHVTLLRSPTEPTPTRHFSAPPASAQLSENTNITVENLPRAESRVPFAASEKAPGAEIRAVTQPGSSEDSADESARAEPAGAAPVEWLWRAGVTAALFIWVIGSVVLALRLAHGLAILRGIRSRLQPYQPGGVPAGDLASCSSLWTSADVHWPMLLGILQPRIVLPAALAQSCTERELRAIVLHERAHLVRGDAWIGFCQRLAGIVFWIHPLMRLLNSRLDQAREEVCDNHVLSAMPSSDYAEVLLHIAQTHRAGPRLIGALSIMERHPALASRVALLLDERRDLAVRVPARQRTLLALGTVSLLMLATLGGLQSGGSEIDSQLANATNPPEPTKPPQQKPAPGQATGSISGSIVGPDGKPAPGVNVWLTSGSRRNATNEQARWQTKSDAKGEFVFKGVEDGRYWVTAFKENLTSRTRVQLGSTFQIAPGREPKSVNLKLQPAVSVTAKVVSQEDGKPIPDAVVRLGPGDGQFDFDTNAKGEAVIRGLTPVEWRLEAFAPGRAAQVVRIDFSKQQAATCEFSLAPGGSIEGRVVDEKGNPVPDVHVMVPQGEETLIQSFTGPDGRFLTDHLPLSTSLTLIGQKKGFTQTSKTFRIALAERQIRGVDITINRRPTGGPVRGVVTDLSGKPIPGAEIFNGRGPATELHKTTTDAQGVFAFDDVEADRQDDYRVTVVAKGFAPLVKDIQPGTATKPAEVALKLEPGHRILGRVVDQEGKPIPNVAVLCTNQELRLPVGTIHTTTNELGRFQLDSLPADAFLGFAAKDYAAIQRRSISTDQPEEAVVVLRKRANIEGRVVDSATGKPLAQFTVRLSPATDAKPGEEPERFGTPRPQNGMKFSSIDGQFDLKYLEAGTAWQLNIQAEGYQAQILRHVVAAAPTAKALEIRLTPEAAKPRITLAGKLVDHKGNPLVGANVMLIVSRDRPLNRRNTSYDWDAIESGRDPSCLNCSPAA